MPHVLQTGCLIRRYSRVALVSRASSSAATPSSATPGKKYVGRITNEQGPKPVANEVGNKQQNRNRHRAYPHCDNALTNSILRGDVTVLHEATSDEPQRGKEASVVKANT